MSNYLIDCILNKEITLNKITLLLVLCLSILYSDEMTSSCKDYEYEECLSNGWKFESNNHRDSLKNYTNAKKLNKENFFVKSYEHIVKARDVISQEQVLKSKMKKNIYSGSALRPRVKTYKTKIKNTYNIKSLELNTSSKNTAQPILIVECSKDKNNIYVHNIAKSFKENKKINNMDLADIIVNVNDKAYNIDDVKSGEMNELEVNIKKCDNLKTSLNGKNSLLDEKSISKIQLLKQGDKP